MAQHNDHCWMFVHGSWWFIVGKSRTTLYVMNHEMQRASVDLSKFRYDDYCRDAYAKLMEVAS